MIDRRPAVIAQCVDESDVVRSVRFARDLGLPVAVRGGGHSVAGTAVNDGGLVVDLRHMRAVTVDPAAAAVRVAGGATTSDMDRATQPYGLATTGGRASTTGVGGFVLGGGTGWLDRCCGLAVDPADDERAVRWVRDVRTGVRPWSTGAVHLNFVGDEGTDRVVAGLGAENTRRLAELKRHHDPDNAFRFNHNIRPAPAP